MNNIMGVPISKVSTWRTLISLGLQAMKDKQFSKADIDQAEEEHDRFHRAINGEEPEDTPLALEPDPVQSSVNASLCCDINDISYPEQGYGEKEIGEATG
tara:strand:+ start:2390 stop:2689 length:300 start_codon:yes stop_codon:yes gene_type:complete